MDFDDFWHGIRYQYRLSTDANPVFMVVVVGDIWDPQKLEKWSKT